MTLQWTRLEAVRAAGEDLVARQMWVAHGEGRHYTVSDLPSAVVETSSFSPWLTNMTADDGTYDQWFSDTSDEAKQRAEDYETGQP